MNVLVTGGAGFLMSNVVRAWLMRDASARIIALDAVAPDGSHERFWDHGLSRVRAVVGDVRDAEMVADLIADGAIDCVVHGAALTHDDTREAADPSGYVRVNVEGTLAVLEAVRRCPTMRQFTYVSSGAVYGLDATAGAGGQQEDGPLDPQELYGITKRAAEDIVLRYSALFGLDVRVIRLSALFGPMERVTGARSSTSTPFLAAQCAASRTPLVVSASALDLGRDILSAEDAAVGVCDVTRAPGTRHRVYNVASGRFTTLRMMLSHLTDALPALEIATQADSADDARGRRGRAAEADVGPALGRFNAYCCSRVKAEFGWTSRPLSQQLESYARWLRADGAPNGPF